MNCVCRRERPAPSDCKMATRERNRLRDRSKSSDISCEPSSSTLPTWQPPSGLSRLASGPSRAAAASTAPDAAPPSAAAPGDVNPRCNADLLVKAAAAVHRAEALQRAEASESDVSPRSRQSGPRLASEHGARRRQREGRDDRQRLKRERSTIDADAEVTADEQQLPHAEEGLPDQAPGHSALETRRVKRKVRSDSDVHVIQIQPFASYLYGTSSTCIVLLLLQSTCSVHLTCVAFTLSSQQLCKLHRTGFAQHWYPCSFSTAGHAQPLRTISQGSCKDAKAENDMLLLTPAGARLP